VGLPLAASNPFSDGAARFHRNCSFRFLVVSRPSPSFRGISRGEGLANCGRMSNLLGQSAVAMRPDPPLRGRFEHRRCPFTLWFRQIPRSARRPLSHNPYCTILRSPAFVSELRMASRPSNVFQSVTSAVCVGGVFPFSEASEPSPVISPVWHNVSASDAVLSTRHVDQSGRTLLHGTEAADQPFLCPTADGLRSMRGTD